MDFDRNIIRDKYMYSRIQSSSIMKKYICIPVFINVFVSGGPKMKSIRIGRDIDINQFTHMKDVITFSQHLYDLYS